MLEDFDYSFSENGLVAYKDGKLIGHTSINDHLGEDNIKVRPSVHTSVHWPLVIGQSTCLPGPVDLLELVGSPYLSLLSPTAQAIVNWTLRYLSELDIPIKR